MDSAIVVKSGVKNILFIGNGFDIAHNLPTRYNHFIDFIQFMKLIYKDFGDENKKLCVINREEKKIKLIENINEINLKNLYLEDICFLDNIYANQLHASDTNQLFDAYINVFRYELCNKNYKNKLKDSNLLNFYQNVNINTNNFKVEMFENEWLNYFILLKRKNEMLWLDFENEIAYVLNLIQSFLLRVKDKKIPTDYCNNPEYSFVSVLDEKSKELVIFFKNITDGGGMFDPDYYKSTVGDYALLDCEKIIQYVFKSFNCFRAILKSYFNDVIEGIIDSGVKYQHEIQDDNINFAECYSFNYTSTFKFLSDQYIQKYIHGSCESGFGTPLILGVGIRDLINSGESQFFNSLYLFTKQYQTLAYKTDYLHFEKLALEGGKIHFYIWGHSLGDSDKIYLDQIFSQISQNLNYSDISYYKFKLIIYYHDEEARSDYLLKLIKYYTHDKISLMIRFGRLTFESSPSVKIIC